MHVKACVYCSDVDLGTWLDTTIVLKTTKSMILMRFILNTIDSVMILTKLVSNTNDSNIIRLIILKTYDFCTILMLEKKNSFKYFMARP